MYVCVVGIFIHQLWVPLVSSGPLCELLWSSAEALWNANQMLLHFSDLLRLTLMLQETENENKNLAVDMVFLGKALVILNLRNQVEPASPALLWQVRDRDRRPISACEPASLEKPTENSKGPVPESRRPLTVSHIHLMHISLPFYTEIWVHRHTDFRNPSHHVCQELHHLFHLETRRGLWRWLIVFYFSSHSTHLPSLSIERKKRHLLYSACT